MEPRRALSLRFGRLNGLLNVRSYGMRMFRCLVLCWLALLPLQTAFGAGKTQASLILPAETVRAGESILVGVQLRMPPKYHTYWRNPGASGMPTKIVWNLPDGVTAGEAQWPVPEKFEAEGLVT